MLAGSGQYQYNYDHKRVKISLDTERKTLGARANTITINGKVYDTSTGLPVDSIPVRIVKKPAVAAPRKTITISVDEPKPAVAAKKTASKAQVVKSSNVHARTQSSKTLMRTVVTRPSAAQTGKAAIVASGLLHQPDHLVLNKSVKSHPKRSTITRNSKVHRFGPTANSTIQRTTKALPVHSAPNNDHAPAASIFALKQAPPIKPRSQSANTNMLQNALNNASNHQTKTIGRKKTRTTKHLVVRIGASLAVVGLLVGFFGYSAMPQLSVRSASRQAGFTASIPSYKPTGFSLNRSVAFKNGQVRVSYVSNTDNRYYTISQSKYQDNQQGLEAQALESGSTNYQIEQTGGLKLYIKNDGSLASWTNKGIWYTVEGTAQLSNFQFSKIASSL